MPRRDASRIAVHDDGAFELLCSLVCEEGDRWGDIAVDVQQDDARAILDPSGAPYNFLTRARGFSKTSDLAGLCIAVMLRQLPPGSKLYGLASDRDQGRLLSDACAGFIARTPELADYVTADAYKVTASNGTQLEILAADVAGAWGLRPAFLVIDEIGQWATTPAPRKLWEATTSAVVKVKGARLVCLTSASDPVHFSHGILKHAESSKLWRVHEVRGPAPWQDPDRLAEQRARLPESSYQRLFENQWTAAEDRLSSLDDLRACVSLDGPQEWRPGSRYVIGLDLGLKKDRTVAAVCHAERIRLDQRDPRAIDGYLHEPGAKVVLDRMAVWQGTKSKPVELGLVEEWVRQAAKSYHASIVVDPWQSIGMAQRLRATTKVVEYSFTQASVGRLAVSLHTAIRDHHLAIPDDPELIDELANVRLRETSPGVFRMDHDPDRHDDRAIAIALCAQELLSHAAVGVLDAFFDQLLAESEAAEGDTYETAFDRAFSPAASMPIEHYQNPRLLEARRAAAAALCHHCHVEQAAGNGFCLSCDPEQARERVQ